MGTLQNWQDSLLQRFIKRIKAFEVSYPTVFVVLPTYCFVVVRYILSPTQYSEEYLRPASLLIPLFFYVCISVSCAPAFKAWPSSNTYSYFYLCRASASYLLVGSYPTTWGREELNLQCLPLGNWFTVSCNTANRCRFPETATRRLAIIFIVPCVALSSLQPFTGNSLL